MSEGLMPDLTTEEVAEVLRVSKVTAQRLLSAGKLRGYQVGGYWRVTREALDEFRAGPPRQPGRPPKPVDPTDALPKRGRGRPRKTPAE